MKLLMQITALLTSTMFMPVVFAEQPVTVQSSCPQSEFQSKDKTWSGHYYLSGVIEVGSELLLEENGHFKWMLAVGSLDQYAEGIWWKTGECIGLKPEAKFLKQLQIFPSSLYLADEKLKAVWADGREQGTYYRPKLSSNP
ncbi:hypothetical protein ABFO59_08375 [Acinetobacter radioresistens]